MKVTTGLVLTGALLFGASLNDPFHFDDALIANDSNVTNSAQWVHFFNPFHLRQFTFFTFYLNHLSGGLDPAGYHFVNVAIHIANAVLLLWLLRRFVSPWIAATAAMIFLVHPLQSEPVLYVYQRSILLACFFSLLALIALAKGQTRWAVLAFFLAFESKESALAVPLAVALLSSRKGWREFESVPSVPLREDGADRSSRWGPSGRIIVLISVVAVAALAVFALIVLADEKTVGINAATRPLHYLITQTRVIYTYLRLLVWPYPQSLEYDFQNVGGLLLGAGIVAMFGAGWMLRSLGIVSFFILLAPTSSIIPSIDAAFEHRLYLPMLSFALLAAYVISKLPRRTWIASAVLAVFAILTLRREMVWSSDIALWEDAAQHAPGKARVWFNLGGAYLNTDGAKARESFLRALTLQPHFPEALYDLGMIEQGRKNWLGALAYYQQALAQDPTYWPACNNIGNTLFSMGEADRSVQYFERTLSLNHDYWPAQYNIAVVHFIKGRYADAVPRLQTVLDWRPDFREARFLLASSLTRAGSRNAADEEWKKLGEGSAAESRHTPTMILAPSRP